MSAIARRAAFPSPVGERTVVLDEALERFPGQIEPVECRIVALQCGDHAQGLGVVIKPAEGGQALVEGALAGMAERRVAEIVGERQRFGEVLVEPQRAGESAGNLRDLERVGEPGAVMVALVEYEHLSLVLEAAKGRRMDDAIAVAAKGAAAFARGLRMEPTAARGRVARIGRARRCGINGHLSVRPSQFDLGQLTWGFGALIYLDDGVAIGAMPGWRR